MSCNQVVITSCTFFFHICFSLAVWINSMLSSTMTQIQMSTWWRTWAAWTGWVGLSLLPNFVLQLVQKTTKKFSGITEGSCFNCSKSLSTKMCVCANGWANSDHSAPQKKKIFRSHPVPLSLCCCCHFAAPLSKWNPELSRGRNRSLFSVFLLALVTAAKLIRAEQYEGL